MIKMVLKQLNVKIDSKLLAQAKAKAVLNELKLSEWITDAVKLKIALNGDAHQD